MSFPKGFKPMSDELQKKIGEFAFADKEVQGEKLDRTSIIKGRNMSMMLSLMRVYEAYLSSKAAPIIANVLERQSWSYEGTSRHQAVISLIQGLYFPENKTPTGFESFGLEEKEKKK